jgi:hypothetical protein
MAKRSPRASRPAVATTRDALLEQFKDYPAIHVLERRLDDPSDPGSQPLLLKDEPDQHCLSTDHWTKFRPQMLANKPCPSCQLPFRRWYVRWINLGEQGRWNTIKNRGYVPVEVAELIDEDAISDLHRSERDTYVRRGERGQEALFKMPLALFVELQYREERQRRKQTDRKTVKQTVAEQIGQQHGSEAGDIVDEEIKVFEHRRRKTTLERWGTESEAESGADDAATD